MVGPGQDSAGLVKWTHLAAKGRQTGSTWDQTGKTKKTKRSKGGLGRGAACTVDNATGLVEEAEGEMADIRTRSSPILCGRDQSQSGRQERG